MALGMQGFDYDRTRTDMGIPDSIDVITMIVVEKRNQGKEPLGSIIILSKKKNEIEKSTMKLKKIRLFVIEQKSHSALLRINP
jgi:hypothetical protein